MTTLIIILIVWAIGACVAYFGFLRKWQNPMLEKIWFSVLWFVTLIMYGIDRVYRLANGIE